MESHLLEIATIQFSLRRGQDCFSLKIDTLNLHKKKLFKEIQRMVAILILKKAFDWHWISLTYIISKAQQDCMDGFRL